MAAKTIKPTHELMLRVRQAFADHGYANLSMVDLAKACGFTRRALYHYFSSKEEAFRASIHHNNAFSIQLALETGRNMAENGADLVDVFAEILNIRYGDTRRVLNRSPHFVELNGEAFLRCRDIMVEFAVSFQADLERLVVEFGGKQRLRLRNEFSPAQVAQLLADGARGVNQSLPPVASDKLFDRYRQMCQAVLYGSMIAA